jgi:hypothetical protein
LVVRVNVRGLRGTGHGISGRGATVKGVEWQVRKITGLDNGEIQESLEIRSIPGFNMRAFETKAEAVAYVVAEWY